MGGDSPYIAISMVETLGKTWSLCPVCLSRIPATKIIDDGNVYLEKECQDHGYYKVLVWRGADNYRSLYRFDVKGVEPKVKHAKVENGCPLDCGICPEHKQDTCLVVMEVTNRCNLNCQICFASSKERYLYEPDLDTIEEMYKVLLEGASPICVQISGGEPTVRDDLPEIVSLGKEMGVDSIEVNTNGIRLGKDVDYLRRLKKGGVDALYLSFDGVTPEVYRNICGIDLFDLKVKTIENCAKLGIGIILVPKLIPHINYHQAGEIIKFAKRWIPTVKGVHFQPLSYFGRYPDEPHNEDRITIPDVLRAIEVQTKGEIKMDNFIPTCCSEIHCDARCLSVLMEDGKLLPLTSHSASTPSEGVDIPKRTRKAVADLWKCVPQEIGGSGTTEKVSCECQSGSWMELMQRATEHYLTISTMHFQDAWNIDLERLKKCCIHVVTPDKRLIPFCAFNVTSINGETLYRHNILSKYAKT